MDNQLTVITVENTVKASVEKVRQFWTLPEHIIHWNNASDDWHTPLATNDLQVGGKFLSRMESNDGSMGFDFNGMYSDVKEHELIAYAIEGGRKVRISFSVVADGTRVVESFETENENSIELQRGGWQSIMDNFKKYVESN